MSERRYPTTPTDRGNEPIVAALTEILSELKEIKQVLNPKFDIMFSDRLELTTEQKRRMALAAINAMHE